MRVKKKAVADKMAIYYQPNNIEYVEQFLGAWPHRYEGNTLYIATLENQEKGEPVKYGDAIIRGVKGEYYPTNSLAKIYNMGGDPVVGCPILPKPEILDATRYKGPTAEGLLPLTLLNFMEAHRAKGYKVGMAKDGSCKLRIQTQWGDMFGYIGCIVIRKKDGSCYICEEDVFYQSYDIVSQ